MNGLGDIVAEVHWTKSRSLLWFAVPVIGLVWFLLVVSLDMVDRTSALLIVAAVSLLGTPLVVAPSYTRVSIGTLAVMRKTMLGRTVIIPWTAVEAIEFRVNQAGSRTFTIRGNDLQVNASSLPDLSGFGPAVLVLGQLAAKHGVPTTPPTDSSDFGDWKAWASEQKALPAALAKPR